MAEALDVYKKDIFDLDGVPAFREFYTLFMFPWKAVYKGFYEEWHKVPYSTINTPKGLTRTMMSLRAAKMAAEQLSRYEWSEKCDITVSQDGYDSEEPDPLNEYLQDVLQRNSFTSAIGEILEKANAMGGGAIKEWVDVPKDEEGRDIGEPRVRLSYHMADQFVPTAWDNKKVKEALFVSREAKDGFYYSRVEWHKWQGETYVVTNDLYRVPIRDAAEPQNILGWQYPLDRIYPFIAPETYIEGLDKTAFQYIRPFGANWCDDNSPLGVAIFSSAMDTLHALDVAFDSFHREFVLGKKRIIVPARALRPVVDQNTGEMVRYFDANDAVYEGLSTDEDGANKIIDNSVELRVEEHVAAINALLALLCGQIGFNANAFAFDASAGMKTATEVISENSKTYGTVQANIGLLRESLTDMVDAILELSVKYGCTWQGQTIESLVAGGYNVSVTFDDSIIEDKAAEQTQALQDVDRGLMSKKTYLMSLRGMTEEEADAELARIADESSIGGTAVDVLFGGTEE